LHELAGINIVNAATPFLRLLVCPCFAGFVGFVMYSLQFILMFIIGATRGRAAPHKGNKIR
jgi:hypothetical protein